MSGDKVSGDNELTCPSNVNRRVPRINKRGNSKKQQQQRWYERVFLMSNYYGQNQNSLLVKRQTDNTTPGQCKEKEKS